MKEQSFWDEQYAKITVYNEKISALR
jgi:hypothetical protein